LAQNTLALNRIYTEWYRSQGYGFDITNSPAYDQAYIHNRSTFEVTDDLVDETFTEYIARPTSLAPVFSR
ncbi:MAG: spore cortex-lytic protein, partial [Clostridia bacterium]|nr:spore cortex-lytic protein [Clostridia bacterium]